VIESHTLTFEEFYILLYNIEACLNSRPIAPLTDTMGDYEPLTPGHFLIGSAVSAIPKPSLLNIKDLLIDKWFVNLLNNFGNNGRMITLIFYNNG